MVSIRCFFFLFKKNESLFLERADEERREKEAKLKLKKKQFRDLLKESNVSIKYKLFFYYKKFIYCFRSTFNEFSSRHSKDERFRAVEKIRDREAWFHEYVQELKTREKEGPSRHNEKEKVRLLFTIC
jgi:transcription elongation regulator 1